MKRKTIQVLLIAMSLTILAGCGGCNKDKKKSKGDEAPVQAAKEIKPTEVPVKPETYKDAEGLYVYAYTEEIEGVEITSNYWINLNDDKSGTLSVQDVIPFTWDASGEIVYENGNKAQFSIEDNELVLSENEGSETRFAKFDGEIIKSVAESIDQNNIPDGEYRAQIIGSEVTEQDGKLIIPTSIYEEEEFDAEAVELAQNGDAIIVDGILYIIDECIVENDTAIINGGNDMGGLYFVKDYDNPVYKFCGFDDIGSFTLEFKKNFEADESLIYTDFSDPSSALTADYYSITDFISDEYLSVYCTVVEVFNGKITSITRNYMP